MNQTQSGGGEEECQHYSHRKYWLIISARGWRGQVTFSDYKAGSDWLSSQLTDCSNEDVNIPSKTQVMAPQAQLNKFLVVYIALVQRERERERD